MRIFRNFYKKIIFLLSFKFLVAADADFKAGIHGPVNLTETARGCRGPIGRADRSLVREFRI